MKNIKSKPLFTIQCYEDRQVNTSVRKDCHISPEFTNGNITPEKCEVDHKPPPPPPMPTENGDKHENGSTLKRDIYDSSIPMKIPNMRKVATLTRIPTPDYNNKNDSLSGKSKIQNSNAEVDSLESYKLKNPENVKPKPPSNYFIKAPNGTETMKKHSRPVSVTIGQYVNNIGGRKEPSKLEFLNGEKKGHQITDNEPISSRLQSELALTLSRSNLRKKTEALDHALYKLERVHLNNENFYARYGNNILPLPPSITIPKVSKLKH